MNVVVINTGTELLLGSVLNTHLNFIARQLFPFGLRIGKQVTVPDGEAIREALTEFLPRADLIFVTGGLGPTTDDITREITAELLGLALRRDEEVAAGITKRLGTRGFPMTDRILRQADVPEGATVLPNENGPRRVCICRRLRIVRTFLFFLGRRGNWNRCFVNQSYRFFNRSQRRIRNWSTEHFA